MRVNFVKMQALGNDFIVVDHLSQHVKLSTAHIKRLGDRQFGVGCDQILLIEPPLKKDSDFYFRIFNANGQEAEQSGNGARCAARFFYNFGFSHRPTLQADCLAGTIELKLEIDDTVTVNMGKPVFQPDEIPFKIAKKEKTYTLFVEELPIQMAVISMGNPHAVLQVENIENAPVKKLGPLISKHSQFPKGANVGFMQIIDPHHIKLRVFERGAGETLACGSGATAAVVAGIESGQLKSPVVVSFAKGDLKVEMTKDGKVLLNGPAVTVFIGQFRL